MQTPATFVWKARPVFLSSTFRGMDEDRNRLRDHAFPRLAEQLRERCHYLDTIDLRQGVETGDEADEAKREMQVLKVCRDEINRSKPFLAALLGERYGWIPPAERITAAARSAGLPPSVEVAGRSVTELEILYGVLENPDQRRRSWFYFRTLDRTDMPPAVAARFPAEVPSADPASPAGRLRALKDRIRRELPGRVRDYTLRWDTAKQALAGLDDLDAMVARDLWTDLDTETAAYLRQAPRTWQEADARAVADFVAERTRGYVQRSAVTDPMVAHALSPSAPDAGWGLVVTGESGSGKSSLFGTVFDALQPRAAAGELVLLPHAAGIFPQSGQVDRMLKRWIAELAGHLGIPDPLEGEPQALSGVEGRPREPQPGGRVASRADSLAPRTITSDDIDKTFASLLAQAAAGNRVVVLIDALNQFETTVRASHLTWLPKVWPVNARLVATAIPGTASAALTARPGCSELPVPPVAIDEARAIAERFYRERHHRDVNPRVLDALLAKRTDLPAEPSARDTLAFQPGGPAPASGVCGAAPAPREALALHPEMPPTDGTPWRASVPASRPAHGNPLWLALALQEMNLLEADDFERADRDYAHLPGGKRMEALQLAEADKLPADVPGVYGELLARAERGFGKAWTDAFVDLIALGRAGWRESDLRVLMPLVSGQAWDDLAFAGVRRALGTHVVQRGAQAQWDFFHAALRETVLRRDLADEAARRRLHGLLADHLDSLPPGDPLRISETMVHLLGLGDRDRAAGYIAGIQPLQWTEPSAKAALAAAVAVLVTAIQAAHDDADRDRLTAWIADLMGGDDDPRTGRVANAVIFDLNDALAVTGEARTEVPRSRLLEAAREALARLALADPFNAGWQNGLSVGYSEIGDMLRAQGDLAGALKAYRESMTVAERLAAADPSNAGWQRDLVASYSRMADMAEKTGQGDAREWWRKAYEQVAGMKARGIMLPTDEQYLPFLRQKAAGEGHP